jgi:hypothetical protein
LRSCGLLLDGHCAREKPGQSWQLNDFVHARTLTDWTSRQMMSRAWRRSCSRCCERYLTKRIRNFSQ